MPASARARTTWLAGGQPRRDSRTAGSPRALARGGLARAASFTWERTARATFEVYRRAAGRFRAIALAGHRRYQRHRRQLERPPAPGGVPRRASPRSRASSSRRSSWTTARPTARPSSCARDFPSVRVVALARESRLCRRQQCRRARGARPPLVLLNNDTVAEPGWLARCGAPSTQPAGFALATSRIVYMHDPGDRQRRRRRAAWGGAFKRYHGRERPGGGASPARSSACAAPRVLSPKAAFEELGGFDEHFFVSHEDVDLSYRARLLGYRCRYVADAVVRHHGSATLGRTSAFAVFHGQRNLEWMYFKNTPLAAAADAARTSALHGGRRGPLHAPGLLGAFLRAKCGGARGPARSAAPACAVQRTRRVGAGAIRPHLEPRWLATKRPRSTSTSAWRGRRRNATLSRKTLCAGERSRRR